MKRILVTGATGNLGRAVVVALRNKGANARAGGRDTKRLQYIGVLYSAVRAGYLSAVTPDVETVTGKKPTTFETFARQSVKAWA